MSKTITVLRASVGLSLAIGAGCQSARADEAPAPDASAPAPAPEEIVVTGSRIQRKDFNAPSPIVTVGTEAVQAAGRSTVESYLKDLPQFTAGTGDYSNNSNGGTAGRATLNLRGLGPQRNLVLLDGRRLMSSGTDGAIDINTIPSLAIARIEIISGGASATYGSDALSGVVNFKVRTDLDGFEMSGQASETDKHDSGNQQLGLAFGHKFAGGRGHVLATGEFNYRGGIAVNQRDFFINTTPSSFIPQGRFRIGSTFLSVNDDGTIFNPATGAGYTGSNSLPFLRGGPGNTGIVGYHGSINNLLQVPLRRGSFFTKVDYEISPQAMLYAQAMYTTSTASNIGAAPNLGGAPWVLTIPATNPFLVAFRAAHPGQFGAGPISVYQVRLAQFGSRIYETTNDTSQMLFGIKGKFADRDLNYDVHASYGLAINKDRTISGAGSVSALQSLLNAADGGNALCAGGFNPVGGQNPLSPACVAFATRTPLNRTTLRQYVVEGNLEGALFQLPAGEARFALTSQFRQNEYNFLPDPGLATGDLANLTITLPTKGTIRAFEAGGELLLPLIKNSPLAKQVDLTLGYRVSNYNLSGTQSTYKAELDAKLNRVVRLRGGYQHALRSPNVGEYFLAGQTQVVGIGAPPSGGDPCDSRNSPTGDRLLLCQAQGVAANFRAAAASGPANTQGNRNLVPETADSLTAGSVFDVPLGGARLNLSADFYTIKIKNAIAPIAAADALQQCYNVTGSTPGFNPTAYLATNFYCGLFSRTVTGDVGVIQQPILNLGSLKTTGVDFAADLRVPARFLNGSINLTSNVNYLIDYKVTTFTTSPTLNYAGTISSDPQQSFPKWRALTALVVRSGPFSINGTWRYISPMRDRTAALNPATTVPGTPAFSYFDVSARVDVGNRFEFFGGVTNLGNKAPPVVGGAPGVTNLGTYDVIGRSYFIGVKAKL